MDKQAVSIDPGLFLASLRLLRESVVLAIKKLESGGVSGCDQWFFWQLLHELQEHIDVLHFDPHLNDAPVFETAFCELIETLEVAVMRAKETEDD